MHGTLPHSRLNPDKRTLARAAAVGLAILTVVAAAIFMADTALGQALLTKFGFLTPIGCG